VALRLVTPPASEPLSLTEAKAHLRIEHTLDDTYLTTLITAARQYVEQIAWRGLLTQTWELTLDRFPGGGVLVPGGLGLYGGPIVGETEAARVGRRRGIELPMGNLVSVASVKYLDPNNVLQTMSPSDYLVETAQVPGRIHLAYGKVWPLTLGEYDAVQIQYTVGYQVRRPYANGIAYAVGDLVYPTPQNVNGHYYKVTTVIQPGVSAAEPIPWPTGSGVTVATDEGIFYTEQGFRNPADELPEPIRQAMLLLISQMYEHRTPEVIGALIGKVDFAFDALIGPYRLVRT
jgi:hypothetical protein